MPCRPKSMALTQEAHFSTRHSVPGRVIYLITTHFHRVSIPRVTYPCSLCLPLLASWHFHGGSTHGRRGNGTVHLPTSLPLRHGECICVSNYPLHWKEWTLLSRRNTQPRRGCSSIIVIPAARPNFPRSLQCQQGGTMQG